MVHAGKASHIGSSLSQMDILAVLYAGAASVTPERVKDPERDVIIVSKGHASAGTYAVMAHAGFFPLAWLDEFCANGGVLSGHVTAGVIPGVELSTGSLGHGLAFGCGIALAAKLSGSTRRVFVLLSDGECDEGSVWEAGMFAAHHGLSNLTAIIDRNGLQSFGSTELTLALEPLGAKWEAFGWAVSRIDGHDHESLKAAFAADHSRPAMLIADTTKGRGVSYMENEVAWHYKTPDDEQLAQALTELASEDA